MNILRIVAFVVALALSPLATATTDMTDASDLWWNPNENGWGLNLSHQDDTVFATLFVYGPSGQPTWYVGSAMVAAATGFSFSGPWYQTTGPWLGGAFNASAIARQVGTATFTYIDINNGTLTYGVDGTTVTKSVTRQTWRRNRLSGSYIGAVIGTYTGCPSSGYQEEPGTLTITHNGTTISIAASFSAGGSCAYSGTYGQAGRMGSISGTVTCSNGASGTFQAFEIEANITGLTGRAQASLGGSCTWSGRFGGLFRGA